MEIAGWITLAAVIVALGIGVTSILQTQILQKRERKERLLNEIIEWAIDVAKCRFDSRPIDHKEPQTGFWQFLVDVQDNLTKQQRIGLYIRKISPTFGQRLHISVIKLVKVIQNFIDVLDQPRAEAEKNISSGRTEISNEEAKLDNHIYTNLEMLTSASQQLDKASNKVIKEATKIKTKDIS